MKRILVSAISIIALLIITIFLVTVPGNQPAKEATESIYSSAYYVAPDGSDRNRGTETQPWRTIQKAANTLVAGETVYIKSGAYRERVIPQHSGSPGSWITYTLYGDGDVTIDGTGLSLSWWDGMFHIDDKDYIKVSGLRVVNSEWGGICIGNNDHIIIENCYIKNTDGSGIYACDMTNLVVDNNELYNVNIDLDNEAISLVGVNTFEVKNNYVHHSHKEGIDAKSGCSNGLICDNHVHDTVLGIYIDGSREVNVYRNVIHHNYLSGTEVGAEQSTSGVENVNIYNNLIYSNWHGLAIPQYHNLKKDIKVVNNTFWNISPGNAFHIYEDGKQLVGLVVRNNILSECTGGIYFPNYASADVSINQNLFHNAPGLYGDSTVIGDPKFLNPSESDFSLQRDSPAIDAGSSIDATSDSFDGTTRPQGAGYDIGAYEYEIVL